jgi:hypothetical protein
MLCNDTAMSECIGIVFEFLPDSISHRDAVFQIKEIFLHNCQPWFVFVAVQQRRLINSYVCFEFWREHSRVQPIGQTRIGMGRQCCRRKDRNANHPRNYLRRLRAIACGARGNIKRDRAAGDTQSTHYGMPRSRYRSKPQAPPWQRISSPHLADDPAAR